MSPTKRPLTATAGYLGLFIISLIGLCAQIDKALIAIVLEPVKHEFRLTDTKLGFLSGLAFALAHACTAIPFGRLADRLNRRNIVALAVICWSVATGWCGFAQSYVQLVLCRAGVGFGEAAGQSASVSMLSDFVVPERRSTALSFYYLGAPLGGLFAMAGGGFLIAHHGWRAVFILAAIPGVVLAAAMLLLHEPERGSKDTGYVSEAKQSSFLDVLRYIHGNRPLFHMMMAIMVMTLVITGTGTWAAAFFIRAHGMAIAHVGLLLGLSSGVLGTFSLLVAGPVADRLARRHEGGGVGVVIGSCLFQLPFMLIAFLWPNPLALYVYLVGHLGMFVWMGPGLATTQMLTPPHMRATVAATIFTLNGLVGYGLGPQLVGVFSDLLSPVAGNHALSYAICAVELLQFWAIAHLLLAIRAMRAKARTDRTAIELPPARQ